MKRAKDVQLDTDESMIKQGDDEKEKGVCHVSEKGKIQPRENVTNGGERCCRNDRLARTGGR